MPISQLFILTPRGDAVVSKDFRGDCPRGKKLWRLPGSMKVVNASANTISKLFLKWSSVHTVHSRASSRYIIVAVLEVCANLSNGFVTIQVA